jgi:predicted CXXCH cytochrome family protein
MNKACKFISTVLTISVLLFYTGLAGSDDQAEDKVLKIDSSASCVTASCHANTGRKKSVHKVGVDGALCILCHEIAVEGEHRFKKISEDTRVLCAKCHSQEFKTPPGIKGEPPKVISADKDLTQHAPFAEGKCTTCHDAHESNYYNHLKKEYPESFYVYFAARAFDLCFNGDCHKGLNNAFVIPRTLTETKFRNGNLNLHFRHVNKVKGRSCSVCHDPHFSIAPRLIRETFEFGKRNLTLHYEKTETGGKCSTTCHKVMQYDRYDPVPNPVNVSPRQGEDASPEDLQSSREIDMKERKPEEGTEQPGKDGKDIQKNTDANK